MDEQLLREFLAEADELIEALYEDVRLWRARGGGGGREGRESVARAFRCVHTIKGSAAAAGLEEVGRLAHELEGLLEGVRAGRVAAETDVLDAFEAAAEGLSEGLSAAARGGAWGVPAPLVERLRRLSARAAAAPRARGEVFGALPREVAESLGEAERARLAEAVADVASVFVVSADFDLSSFDERFRQLSEVLSEGGEVVSTLPGVSEVEAGGVNFRVVYATREGREQTRARVAHFGATLLADASDAGFNDAGAAPASSDEGPGDEAGEGARGGGRSLSALTMLVRVPLEELDELTSAAHQIFNDSLTAIERAAGGLAEGEARAEAEAESKRLRRRFF